MSDNLSNQEVIKYVLRNKSISKSQRELKYLYINADQLLNKIADLKVFIAADEGNTKSPEESNI